MQGRILETSTKLNSGSIKVISNILGFLTYWLVEEKKKKGSSEIVLGLDRL